jgi:hypothetical protein
MNHQQPMVFPQAVQSMNHQQQQPMVYQQQQPKAVSLNQQQPEPEPEQPQPMNPNKMLVSERIQYHNIEETRKQNEEKYHQTPKHTKITTRKVYNVGKKNNTVSVLISNYTVRNEVKRKKTQVTMEPISKIKSELIHKGLIKIGSTAPNDVLRKMYESTILIDADVKNHNTSNLLHNYLLK